MGRLGTEQLSVETSGKNKNILEGEKVLKVGIQPEEDKGIGGSPNNRHQTKVADLMLE